MSISLSISRALCAALDRPDWLDDPRLATRHDRYESYDVLAGLIREQARTQPRDEWFARFVRHDLPHAPLNTVLDLAGDEQVRAMRLIRQLPMPDGPAMAMAAPPVRFSANSTTLPRPAPLLGGDNEALLPKAVR